jgi:uncharacterized protein (DUF2147 family)
VGMLKSDDRLRQPRTTQSRAGSGGTELIRALAVAFLLLLPGAAIAQALTPAGLWKTFSDHTGEADGLVRIVEVNGEFIGKVLAVFSPPATDPNPLCEECSGELKDQPVVGMTILRGLRWDGEEYSGGEILDPDDGRVYRCRLRLAEGGRKLQVRGFIGISLFGRTQTWERQE